MVLNLKDVTKTFKDHEETLTVLSGVNLQLIAGQSLALTGDSGCGKSTLLHIAAGLEAPTSGDVFVADQNLAKLNDIDRALIRRKTLSIIFQQFNLIPSMTVDANLRFQAELSGRLDEDNVSQLIEALGLRPYLNKYPETLSGGQQQRVAIARSLAMKPALLLADEPTGNLDERTADDVLNQLLSLVSETDTALLIVTHSPGIAACMNSTRRLHCGQIE